jgi:hypothetical protein
VRDAILTSTHRGPFDQCVRRKAKTALRDVSHFMGACSSHARGIFFASGTHRIVRLHSMVVERRRGPASDELVYVRLTHKYAETIDGVDLSAVRVGDLLHLSSREAALLIREGWAVASSPRQVTEHRHVSADQEAGRADTRKRADDHQPRPPSQHPTHASLAPVASSGCENDGARSRRIQQPPARMST